MKKTVIMLMFITIFSKFFGFIRDITLSYFYGASEISDIYLISLTIPSVIFSFIGIGISTGYIPMYTEIQKNHGEKIANKFTSNLINIVLLICTMIILLVFLFTEHIVKIFASGFEGKTLDLAIQFTRISIFGIYFYGLIYIFKSFLQIKKKYIATAFIAFPLNFFMVLFIFLSSMNDVLLLAIGSVVATASQFVLLLPFIFQSGYKYNFIFDLQETYIKKLTRIAVPAIIGISVNQINVLVDRTIASQLVVGGISALDYANRVNGFAVGIFVLSISTVLYPTISKFAVENNIKKFKSAVLESIGIIILLVIPVMVGTLIFAEPIVKFLFGRGEFDSKAISMTSSALFFYSIGLIGFSLREILSRAFYSLKDTKTPMINATIGVIINIILNIVLSKFLGIGGLALATSISAIISSFLLFISLRKKIGTLRIKLINVLSVKVIFASIIMGIGMKFLYKLLIHHFNDNLSFLISVFIGVFTYFIMLFILQVREVEVVIKSVKETFKKNNY